MAVENYEIMFAVYDSEDGAAGAVEALHEMAKDETISIVDAATLVKHENGETTVKQESLPSVKKGAAVGAVIGGVLGVLFPPSIIGAAALGAGIGAGTSKLAKMAMEDEDLKEAAESLQPGQSAFVAIVDNTWVTQVSKAIEGYDKLHERTLDADAAGVLGVLAEEGSDASVTYGAGRDADSAAEFVAIQDEDAVAMSATAVSATDEGVVVEHVEAAATGIGEGDSEESDENE